MDKEICAIRRKAREGRRLAFYACRRSRQQIKLIPLRSYHWQTSVARMGTTWRRSRRHGVTGLLENFPDQQSRHQPWLPADIPFTIEPLTVVNWVATVSNTCFPYFKFNHLDLGLRYFPSAIQSCWRTNEKKERGNLTRDEHESRNTSWITNYSDSFPW